MDTDPVSLDRHADWFNRSLADPSRRILVAELHGTPVGVVRIDSAESVELSWTVAPEWRGRGIGRSMVAQAAGRVQGRCIARIRRENEASQAVAEAAGFRLVSDGALQLWERACKRDS